MLRMIRSSAAPVGMFVLFLGLAVVPLLLNSDRWNLKTRLGALDGAWNRVASVFLAVYQPSNAAQLLALDYYSGRGGAPATQDTSGLNRLAFLSHPESGDESETVVGPMGVQASTESDTVLPAPLAEMAKGTPAVAQKRCRLAAAKAATTPPVNLARIDLFRLIEQAIKNEGNLRFIDSHQAEYRIRSKFELSKVSTRIPVPASYRYVFKKEPASCETAPEATPRPSIEPRGGLRPNRISVSYEIQS